MRKSPIRLSLKVMTDVSFDQFDITHTHFLQFDCGFVATRTKTQPARRFDQKETRSQSRALHPVSSSRCQAR